MYCRKCRKTIPDDSVYCPYCGEPTDPGTRKASSGAHRLVCKVVLSVIVVIAALAGIAMVIRWPAPEKQLSTAETQSTVSTLPPDTTAEVTETTVEATETAAVSEETQSTDDPDPWRHVDTMEQAEKILGFGLEAPEMVKEFEAPWINVATGCSNLWVSYHKYTQEHDPMYYDRIITVGRSIYIVKYPCPDGSIFVSPESKQKLIQVDGNDVVLVMDGNEVVSAQWAADGYAYDLSFENMGLTAYSVVPLISQTH